MIRSLSLPVLTLAGALSRRYRSGF